MIVALIALQLAGLAGLYLVLRRRIDRNAQGAGELTALRSEVADLIAEMNATAERNVTLLEDRVRCLNELLRRADGSVNAPAQPAPAGAAREREAQVMLLRRLGFSSALIADRLAASQAEVELIVNLAADRGPALQPPASRNPAPRATET